MREIKFRAWDKKEKKMYGEGLTGVFDLSKCLNERMNNDDLSELMQFTGLKDDNGKEIYDQDIIDYGSSDLLITVEWNDDTCKFQFSDGTDINDNETYGRTRFVVGNIYENPELIN